MDVVDQANPESSADVAVGEEHGHDHVLGQKDIQDFWDHVSNEDRISDVCTTFASESKQVTSKLLENSASLPEKFAVANFLLQVGALQFQVQQSATNPNEYHTVIILQKPDNPQSTEVDAVPPEKTEKGSSNGDDQVAQEEGASSEEAGDKESDDKEESDDDDAAWKKDPNEAEQSTLQEAPSLPQSPQKPERHECGACGAFLASLWELDLHVLNECQPQGPVRRGRPKMKRPPEDDLQNLDESQPPDPLRRGGRKKKTFSKFDFSVLNESRLTGPKRKERPKKKIPPAPPGAETLSSGNTRNISGSKQNEVEKPQAGGDRVDCGERSLKFWDAPVLGGVAKRKRGRPRKVIKEEQKSKSVRKLEVMPASTMPLLAPTRSRRERRLPLKFQDVLLKRQKVEQRMETSSPQESEKNVRRANISRHDEDEGNITEVKNHKEEEQVLSEAESSDDISTEITDDVGLVFHNKPSEKRKRKGPPEKDQCGLCLKKVQRGYLERHMLTVHSEKRDFKCSTCGKIFALKSIFKRHLIGHQNKASETSFTCDICEATFKDKYILNNHVRIHKKKENTCEFCNKAFVHWSMMQRHRNNVHTKEVSYPCTLCDKVYYLKNRLQQHLKTHSGKKEFKCNLCDLAFFLPSQLQTHKNGVHIKGKNFLCDMCGSSFKSKATLKQHHLTAHTDIKQFPCRQCGKPFSRSTLRNQHEKVHAGHNPYPCEHCGKGFRDKFKLQVHVNWHLGIRPYSCDVCHRAFLVKGNLTKHARIHTGERPYVCEECGRGCIDSSQLKKHMKQHHRIDMGRQLTKGPERKDGALPSQRTRRKKPRKTPQSEPVQEDMSMETQAYTIATDALIEISQQLMDTSHAIPVGQHVDIGNNAVPANTTLQHGATEIVSTAVPNAAGNVTASTDNGTFPVMIHVNAQDNQVTVPVTQSIGDFQSLELISL